MGNKFLPWILAGILALGLLALIDRSCGGPNPKYWVKRADYDAAAKDANAQHVTDMGTIVTQEGTIEAKDADIAKLKAVVVQKSTKIETLRGELATLQGDEPPTTPEIESLPLVINLRAQIGNLTQALSISAEIITTKDGIISDWSVKFDAQATISETWKRAYNDEHALRLTCDSLRLDLERQFGGKVWVKVLWAAAGAGAGLVLGKVIK